MSENNWTIPKNPLKSGVLKLPAKLSHLLTNFKDSDIFVNRCNKFVINHRAGYGDST